MPAKTLRIVSFNIFYALRHGRLARSVREHFTELDPDVIALQEVLIGKKRNFARDLADALAMHLSFSLQAEYGPRQVGLATLSRSPAEETSTIMLPRSPIRHRIMQIVQLTHKGTPWRIANTHLSVASSAVRREQIASVTTSLNGHPDRTPLILAGDFNTKTRKEVAHFSTLLHDAGFAAPETLPYSWRFLGAKRRMDWIAGKYCEIPAIETMPRIRGSDHVPVWADIAHTPHN